MKEICGRLFENMMDNPSDIAFWNKKIAGIEQKIDDMTEDFRENMYARIRAGKCTDEGGILFSEMLTDFERIGDHALNIADEMVKIAGSRE